MRFQPVKCNIMQIARKRIKKINASYSLEGTVLDNVEKIKYFGVTNGNGTHMSAIFAQRLTRPLAPSVHEMLKSRLTKDWCVQSWSMVVQFGTPKAYFFKMNLSKFRKEQLDL